MSFLLPLHLRPDARLRVVCLHGASSEFAFQPPCMHMYHPLFRSVRLEGVKLSALLSPGAV